MAGDWREVSLGDLVEIQHGFAFSGGFFSDEPPGDILLTPGNFAIGGGFQAGKVKYYTGPAPDDFVLNDGDLLVTMTDLSRNTNTLGSPALVPHRGSGSRLLHNQRLGKVVIRPDAALEQRYLFYLLRSREYRDEVLASATGTTVKHTSPARIRRFRFRLPPILEQRAIAHILGTLDDKIELTRRMNETLEAISRALFKSWFVDFDPVRAKSEGRDPGLPPHLADLFPDSFEDSELGQIPEGWGTLRLGDLLVLEKGLSYKGQFLGETGMPMVNLGCFLSPGRFAGTAMKHYFGEFRDRHVVRPRDLVIANTDLTQKREVIGCPALIPPQDGLDKLLFTHHVFAARFREGQEPWKLFAYFSLLQEEFRERATGFATGTTVLALPRDAVLGLQAAAPPAALVRAFGSIAFSVIERQWKTMGESATLAAVRDTLLPKLVSGELEVPVLQPCASSAL